MNLREELLPIKMAFISGEISYEEARNKCQPIIDNFNQKAKEIAKKHGRKFKNLTFTGLFR